MSELSGESFETSVQGEKNKMSLLPPHLTEVERLQSSSESEAPRHTSQLGQPFQSNGHAPSIKLSIAKTGPQGHEPASPTSTGSAIAVGRPEDATLMASIERGDYAAPEQGDFDDTRSLTESIRQHIIDGGLRYHAYHAGQYAFPNDETEQYRDDLKHSLSIYLSEGRYFFSPIHQALENGGEVLDLGTGPGKWCIELADMYPQAQFYGMDLSPIQPDWVPANVEFVVDDIEHEGGWTYQENMFAMIHMRHTLHSIRNRKEVFERIYKHLKPGGYFEVCEFLFSINCDDSSCDGPYAFRDFLQYMRQGYGNLGGDLDAILKVQDELREAGFVDLDSNSLKCPIGPWAKKSRLQECGYILRDSIMDGLIGLSRRPFRDGLGWTQLQIEMFLVDVRKSVMEEVNSLPKYHSYFPFHSVWGRKPLDA